MNLTSQKAVCNGASFTFEKFPPDDGMDLLPQQLGNNPLLCLVP